MKTTCCNSDKAPRTERSFSQSIVKSLGTRLEGTRLRTRTRGGAPVLVRVAQASSPASSRTVPVPGAQDSRSPQLFATRSSQNSKPGRLRYNSLNTDLTDLVVQALVDHKRENTAMLVLWLAALAALGYCLVAVF